MVNEINIKLQKKYLYELGSEDLSLVEKGQLIKNYMEENKMSFRDMQKEFNIPTTTMHTWVTISDLGDNKYNKLKNSGITKTEIANIIKNTKAREEFKKSEDVDKAKLMLENPNEEEIDNYIDDKLDSILHEMEDINNFDIEFTDDTLNILSGISKATKILIKRIKRHLPEV